MAQHEARGNICKLYMNTTKGKGKVHPCTGTEALYRPYGLQGQ